MNHKITNRATGSIFESNDGEAMLDAAHRQDLHFNYSCLNGTCGSCMADLVEGVVDYPKMPPDALSEDEQAHRKILLCQAVACSDCTIIAREPAALKDIKTTITAARVRDISFPDRDVALIHLQLPNSSRPRFLAGQYIEVILDNGKRRAFSIANAPEIDGPIELHIRHVPGGGFTDYVFNELKPGLVVQIEIPLGTFFLREQSARPVIFVAGGTGFAPIKAIMEHLLALQQDNDSKRQVHLYWGSQSRAGLYMHDVATHWADQNENIGYTPVISNEDVTADQYFRTGFVHQAVIEDHPDLSNHDVYMSGPPPLIDAARKLFARHGLPRRHLYYDSFEFAADIMAIRAAHPELESHFIYPDEPVE